MQLSQKRKMLYNFFLILYVFFSILNISKKMMTFIASAFLKLRTPKDVVRSMPKKSRLREPFDK